MTGLPTSDFFRSHEGTVRALPDSRRERARLHIKDFICNLKTRFSPNLRKIHDADSGKIYSVLIVGVEVPSRAADIHKTITRLRKSTKHNTTVSIAPMLDRGKFANLDAAIADSPSPLSTFDWLVLTDDDIEFSSRFLDDLIAIAAASDLGLSQPAHAYFSHTTYSITRRRYGSLARRTNFVEIGPLTLVRADLFDALIPSPPSRWCYGIDLLWSVRARQLARRIGIIDGATVRHTRPVAASYNMDEARAEGERLIVAYGVTDNRSDLFGTDEVILRT